MVSETDLGKYQPVFFLLILTLNIGDILCDWLFYADINGLKKGLVFGPIDSSLLYTLLAFAILSTILNVAEIITKGVEVKWQKVLISSEKSSLITIWFGELPLVIINIVTSACREESVNIFQLSKASVILLGTFIRIIFFFLSNCRHCLQETKSRKIFVICVIGLLLNSGGSVVIFIFTQTRSNSSGQIHIETPQTLFHEIRDHEQYFQGVGIFFNHPSFQSHRSNEELFIRLIGINEIRKKDGNSIFINYEYQDSKENLVLSINKKIGDGPWLSPQRYMWNKMDNRVEIVNNHRITNQLHLNHSVIFSLTFTPPTRKIFNEYIFGQILFNVKDGDGKSCSHSDEIGVKYFRSKERGDDHLIKLNNPSRRFYTRTDLTDIQSVWRTGWLQCECTGSLQPEIDRSVFVPCFNRI